MLQPSDPGKLAFLLGTHPSARDPGNRAAIIRFASIAAFFYIALILFQPVFHRAYGHFYRGLGTAMFSQVGRVGSVVFLDLHSPTIFQEVDLVTPGDLPRQVEIPKPEKEKDTLLVLQNRDQPGKFGLFRSGSRLMAFVPTALFLSLFIATPFAWPRKVMLLVLGTFALHAFIILRVWIYVMKVGFADAEKKYAIYEPGPFWNDLLRRADNVLVQDPTFNYIVPVFVWLVIVLGMAFWTRYRERAALAVRAGSKRAPCPKCGKSNRVKARCCAKCGAALA